MKAKIYVTLKDGIHDPQGSRLFKQSLHMLGFDAVQDVRIGKFLEVQSAGDGEGIRRSPD